MSTATTVSSPQAGAPEGDVARFVGFRLEQQRYALPLKNVERALRMVAVTPVPEAPAWVLGVINLHGEAIPTVDLRQRFGHPAREPNPDDRLLVAQTQDRAAALMVDEVTDVLEVPAQEVQPVAASVSQSHLLLGVIRRGQDLVLILDATQLLPPETVARSQ